MTADERHSNAPQELADRQLIDALTAMDFRAPSLAQLWSPTEPGERPAGPLRRLVGRRLQLGWRTGVAVLALALVLAAGGLAIAGPPNIFPVLFGLNARFGCPDPDSCGPSYQVTARVHSEIPTVRVEEFNVVVAPGTSRDQIAAIANAFAARHRGLRTIVYFFSESSGQERYSFSGVMPANTDPAAEPAPTPAVVHAWLGLFDFAPNGEAVVQWGPGG